MDLDWELASLVLQVPAGRVATLVDLADGLGDPRAAVAVLRVLRGTLPPGVHRIVRATGEPVVPGSIVRLRREGVRFAGGRVQDLGGLRFGGFHGPQTLRALREEQTHLSRNVEREDRLDAADRFAGFDVSYSGDDAFAAAVVTGPDGAFVLQETTAELHADFPYIPGYLAYREFPAVRACFERLEPRPDVALIDGHGVLHPARLGIASYVGVSLDVPTIGVAKSLLVGTVRGAPPRTGGTADVVLDGEVLGRALRSSASRRLLYVSPGHRVSLETATDIVRGLCRSRIPEPLRRADGLAAKTKRKGKKKRERD